MSSIHGGWLATDIQGADLSRPRSFTKKLARAVPLMIILFAFWLILTARVHWSNLLTGIIISFFLALITSYVMPPRFNVHFSIGFVLRLPPFAVLLIWEIIKANWDVFKRVMAPSLPIDPRIAEFDTCLESDVAKTVLAGSINLTPGTVTLEVDGSRFYVHCLAEAHDRDLVEGRLQRMVAWLFQEGPRETRRMR